MILTASHIHRSYGSDVIIRDASLLIHSHDKVAIVGNNGAGKTTFLDILTGAAEPDGGSVSLAAGTTIGYLRQINDIEGEDSILSEMTKIIRPVLDLETEMQSVQESMKNLHGEELEKCYERYNRLLHAYESSDGYAAQSRMIGVLKGLGFTEEEFDKPMSALSGGEKTRLFLGKILVSRPDIIFLDEPTNHLDLSGIEWLETYLMNYPGTVVIVSHDRYFLDRIVNRVVDIDRGEVRTYEGNYSQFAEKKRAQYEADVKAYLNQQAEIKHQEAVIEKLQSFNREKSIKRAESRKKMLDKIDRLDKPTLDKTDMHLFFTQTASSGKDVLTVEHLGKTFEDGETLFRDISFELKRGEHVAVIGDNGTGKTTILKMITGGVEPTSGTITYGSGVEIAYFDQEHQVLDKNKTIFEEIQDDYPDMDNTSVRDLLASFLFTGDDVFKRIGDLSGGEVGRVSLAKLMLSKANLLILDEPTNHLDMVSKEILERAVRSFEGTVLYVSHDRYFINQTATRILNLTGGQLLNYIGNYDYYLEKRADMERYKLGANAGSATGKSSRFTGDTEMQRNAGTAAENPDGSTAGVLDSGVPVNAAEAWKQAKQKAAEKKKRMARIDKLENEIHQLEDRLQEIEEAFDLPENQTNSVKLQELQKEKDAAENRMEELLSEWEELLSEEEE